MGRTAGSWLQDTALPDGQIFIPASVGQMTTGSGTGTLTRNAKGDIGVVATAAGVWDMRVESALLRFGMQDDAQQAFGAAVATGGFQGQQAQPTPPTLFATPYQQSGRPPFTIAQNEVVPLSRPKGIAIKSVSAIYSVATSVLTTAEIGITKTVFANGIAPVITDVLAFAANGLPVAVTTEPAVTNVAILAANQTFFAAQNTELIVEVALTPGTSVCFYGIVLNVNFNFN